MESTLFVKKQDYRLAITDCEGTLEISYTSTYFIYLSNAMYFDGEGTLESTLFVKKQDYRLAITDYRDYRLRGSLSTLLHNSSFHPKSCKKGVIYSQALRYRRIITSDEKPEEQLEILTDNLIRRGYNLSEIKTQFNKSGNTHNQIYYWTTTNKLHRPLKISLLSSHMTTHQ